jgi:tetratricopeptide (TPR) repeat protein
MSLLGWGRTDEATELASAWREAEPAEVMALVALGETLEATEQDVLASRVYGSIIDLFPDRADMRRFAGQRLDRLGPVGRNLALDTYQRAREQHPDHPSSHRSYAFALLRAGEPERAFDVLARALLLGVREEGWGAAEKMIREDLGLIAAAWLRQRPEEREHVLARLDQLGAVLETGPSLRFVLTWETAGSDVDLHVRDGAGDHASYEHPVLESGGMLYADVREGFGPEQFTISGRPRAYPYELQAQYYARGPMGYGMGKLEIVEHDGSGGLKFEHRPFVVTRDRALVDLGLVEGPLPD